MIAASKIRTVTRWDHLYHVLEERKRLGIGEGYRVIRSALPSSEQGK